MAATMTPAETLDIEEHAMTRDSATPNALVSVTEETLDGSDALSETATSIVRV